MPLQKYEYYLQGNTPFTENSTCYENLEYDVSGSVETETLDLEYYREVPQDLYFSNECTYSEKYFNGRNDASMLFNENLPCYILPVMYQQPDGRKLFHSEHKVYPSSRQVRLYNSLPSNNVSNKLYTMESTDNLTETESAAEDEEDDRRSIYTDYLTNTDVVITEDDLTMLNDNQSGSDDSKQEELESIYTSNFMYESTLTDTNSQSIVGPLITNGLSRSCSNEKIGKIEHSINENNKVSKCNEEEEEEEEETMDNLDRFLSEAAQGNMFNQQAEEAATRASNPIILIYIKSIFIWLKLIPVYTYKYCLRHVLFI